MTRKLLLTAILAPILAVGASAEKAPAITFEAGQHAVSNVLPKFKAFCRAVTLDLQGAKTAGLSIPKEARDKIPHPNLGSITITAERDVTGEAGALSTAQGQAAARDAVTVCTGDSPTEFRVVPNLGSGGDTNASILKGDRKVGSVSSGNNSINVNVSGNVSEEPLISGTKYQVRCNGVTPLGKQELIGSKLNTFDLPVSNNSALARPDQALIGSQSDVKFVFSGEAEDALTACGAKYSPGSNLRKDNVEIATGSVDGKGVTVSRYDDPGKNKPFEGRSTAWTVRPMVI